jgi:HD-GYP domain-containing protein (c-di-GMP phosphodiesterase class II)
MGFEGEELDRVYYIALLHDCGKIGVPDNILRKPGRLTDEEFEVIKSHTKRGGEILSSFKSLKDVDEGALYHHERYDGSGYPEHLSGESIPFEARIMALVDVFDALVSKRYYKKPMSYDEAFTIIFEEKGSHFDPELAMIFIAMKEDIIELYESFKGTDYARDES